MIPVMQAGGLKPYFQNFWEGIYAQRFANLGSTATIWPGIDAGVAITATTHTTRVSNASGSSQTATWTTAPSGLAVPFTETPVTTRSVWTAAGYYGPAGVPGVKFNGTSEFMTVPDAAYWTRALAPMSICCWAMLTAAPVSSAAAMMGKWDNDVAADREYRFVIDTDSKLYLYILDGTAGVVANRASNAAITFGIPHHFAVTYSGVGAGLNAADNVALYIDGAVIASTATGNASWVTMRDGAGLPTVGALKSTTTTVNYWPGVMWFGPLGPAFMQVQLTAAQVNNEYVIGRGALGLG